jgi:RimJ/RimL family protein N-acetyltransferase
MNSADGNPKNPKQLKADDGRMSVRLRGIEPHDLPTLFEFQLDPEANRLAATHPRNSDGFDALWDRILEDPSVTAKAILVGDALAGSISCFKSDGHDSIGYWVGKEFWGQGVATQALVLLLDQVPVRPLHARVALSNTASLRVLRKCGFEIVGYQQSPGDDRYRECEEAILELAEDGHE